MARIKKIGWVGLGKMGYAMAKRLLAHGYHLTVFDINTNLVRRFERLGAEAARTLEEVGIRSEMVWVMIPHNYVKQAVIGKNSISSQMLRGRIIVDGGNSDPRVSRYIYRALKKRRISFLDVGCSGGPARAKQANLSLMVGGDKNIYDRILPILKIVGTPEYLGPSGSGHLVKMLHNSLEQVYMMGIGEVLSFAEKLGLDPKQVARVVDKGVCRSLLLQLYDKIPEYEIRLTLPYVEGGTYSKWASELANSTKYPLLFTRLTYLMREFSRHDRRREREHSSIRVRKETKEEVDKLLGDKNYRSFAIQALLRREFGGHKVRKKNLH